MRRKIRKAKRKFRRFWNEWGLTLEELEMLVGACGVMLFPFILRIIFAFFGI